MSTYALVDGVGQKFLVLQWDGTLETGSIAQALVMQPEVAIAAFTMQLPWRLKMIDRHGAQHVVEIGDWLLVRSDGEIVVQGDARFRRDHEISAGGRSVINGSQQD